jgi:RND family efflux transporter MFP subunit
MKMEKKKLPPCVVTRTSAAALLAFTCCSLACCSQKTAASQSPNTSARIVAVTKVMRQNLSQSLTIAAEFQPYQEINVYAKVSGYIKRLYVDWGTRVKTGQPLAVLEIPELEQQIEEDQAAVQRSVQDVASAREKVNESKSAYDVAHLTATRLTNVSKSQPGLVAQEELDVAQGKDIQASASLSAARDTLAAADQELLVSKAALQKDQAMYSYAHITAPFDGVVTELDAYTGALLPAGTSSNKGDLALCRVSQINPLRLNIPVPEAAVHLIHVGLPAQVQVPSLQKTYEGKVARFSDRIDLDTRTMYTEIDVPNPNHEIVPGMYAYATLVLQESNEALVVPVQVLRESGSSVSVFRVGADNTVQEVPVTLGLQNATQVEILSGLNAGDVLIVSPSATLHNGETVSPKSVQVPTIQGES